jgi:hypothetical protein
VGKHQGLLYFSSNRNIRIKEKCDRRMVVIWYMESDIREEEDNVKDFRL